MNKACPVTRPNRVLFGALLLAATGAPSASLADNCWASEDRSASLDATGVSRVVINAGPGELQIRGESGRGTVQADGLACASAERYVEAIRLETRREGETIYIDTILPDIYDGLLGFTRYATLDLVVLVPDSVAMKVKDSSGELKLSRVQAATVEDSSGSLHIQNIAGHLEVGDGSGELEIEDVGGLVRVRDGSGEIEIDKVGSVDIIDDGSGEIEIGRVAGNVRIRTDGSGSIDVRDVQGNVTIDNDGSGGIDAVNVGGDLIVRNEGSGGVDHRNVRGRVQVRGGEVGD